MPDVIFYDGSVTSIDLSQTGEKTVATISTTLPAGANGIVVAIHLDYSSVTGNIGTFRIKRGTTILSEQQQAMEIPYSGANTMKRSIFLLGYDSSAPSNPTYTITFNETTASGGSINVEVKALIVNGTPMAFADGSAVTISANSSATLVSLSTTLPTGNYVVVAATQFWLPSGQSAISDGLYSYIYRGTTVKDGCPYGVGTTGTSAPQYTANLFYEAGVPANASWSVIGSNGSSSSVSAESKILVFKVGTGWYISAPDVGLTTSDTTIAQVTTEALAGDKLGVIAFNTYRNRSGVGSYTIAYAGYQKLQMNNSTTGQQVNDIDIYSSGYVTAGEHPYIAFLKTFTPTSNRPSFQVKNCTVTSGYAYGQAKLLAFSFIEYVTKQSTDSLGGLETLTRKGTRDLSTSIDRSNRQFRLSDVITSHEVTGRSFRLSDVISSLDSLVKYQKTIDSLLSQETSRSLLVAIDQANFSEMLMRSLQLVETSHLLERRNILFPYLDWADLSEIAHKIIVTRDRLLSGDLASSKNQNIYDKAIAFDTRECLKYRIGPIFLSDIGRRAIIKSDHHNLRLDALILITNTGIHRLKSVRR